MRYLFLTSEFDPFRGGIGTYVRDLARATAEAGHEVVLSAPDYGKDCSAIDCNLPFKVERFGGGQHTFRDIWKKIRLVQALRRRFGRFDVVHAADWPFYIPIAVSDFRNEARCYVTFHGTEINYIAHRKRKLLLAGTRFWNGWCIYVTNSQFTTELLCQRFPQVPRDKIRTVGLGVARSWFGLRQDREKARRRAGLSEQDFFIMTLGRVVPRKGHMNVARALKRIVPANARRIVWQVVGPPIDTAYAEALKQEVAGAPFRTVFAGVIETTEVGWLLSAADLFCMSAQLSSGEIEGFGLVFLEAGCFEVPSVATRVGGIPDAIDDEETGLLVEPQNTQVFTKAIERLMADGNLRRRLGQGAMAKAERSSWEEVARLTYGSL